MYEWKKQRLILLWFLTLLVYDVLPISKSSMELQAASLSYNANQGLTECAYVEDSPQPKKPKRSKHAPKFSFARWFDDWFGSDAPPMSDAELEGIVCAASATTAAILIIAFGGAVMTLEGDVMGAAEKAIALPIIIPSMWGACAIGKTATPGVIWLYRRSQELMKRITPPGYMEYDAETAE